MVLKGIYLNCIPVAIPASVGSVSLSTRWHAVLKGRHVDESMILTQSLYSIDFLTVTVRDLHILYAVYSIIGTQQ